MKKFLLFGLLSFCVNLALSQTLLYNEDFSAGMPTGWVTSNSISNDGLWTYCPNEQGSEYTAACPQVWSDNQNDQVAFQPTTAANGFVVMDSDRHARQNGGNQHASNLITTSFDFSENSEVWLKFEYQIGIFTAKTTQGGATVEVNTGGSNWTRLQIRELFSGNNPYPAFVRWSRNPEMMIIDISNLVAGESDVSFRWRWFSGNEFFWAIDDIDFYDADPSSLWLPERDLEMTKYIAGAPNYMTPVSQMEPFGFFGDFVNRSYLNVDDITFKASIKNPDGVEVFADSVFIESVPPDALKPDVLFLGESPIFAKKGIYTGKYEVTPALGDDMPIGNTQAFNFEITNDVFAKDSGAGGGTVPEANQWNPNEPHNWSWGNIYYTPNGEGYEATGISFAFAPADDTVPYEDIAGTELKTILYEWNNLNGDDVIDEDERAPIYTTTYTVKGDENEGQLILTEFQDDDILDLKNDTYYIAMVDFEAQPGIAEDIKISTNIDVEYGSMMLRTATLGKRRFASALTINSTKSGAPNFSIQGFGLDVVPVVRLHIDKIVGTNDLTNQERTLLNIFPNPTTNTFQIENKGIAFDNWNDVYIEVNAVDGKNSTIHRWGSATSKSELINIEQLPAGTYQVTIASKSSPQQITKTLVIQ